MVEEEEEDEEEDGAAAVAGALGIAPEAMQADTAYARQLHLLQWAPQERAQEGARAEAAAEEVEEVEEGSVKRGR